MTRRHERILWVLAALALADLSALVTGRGAARALDEAVAPTAASEVEDPAEEAEPEGNREAWPCEGYVALTFDDGPHPETTPWLLEELEIHGLRATFFLVGRQVERFPELAQRIVDEGHELANHTYDHPDLRQLGDGAIDTQLRRDQRDRHRGGRGHPALVPSPVRCDQRPGACAGRGARHDRGDLEHRHPRLAGVGLRGGRGRGDDRCGGRRRRARPRPRQAQHPGAIAAVAADYEARGLCSGELAVADEGADDEEPILGIEGLTVRPWGSS
jgi:hypothetical protein